MNKIEENRAIYKRTKEKLKEKKVKNASKREIKDTKFAK